MDKYDLELLDLVFQYSINYKEADRNFIIRAQKIINNKFGLNGYINDTVFSDRCMNNNTPIMAEYFIKERRIIIYLKDLKYYLNYPFPYKNLLHSNEVYFQKNILVLQVLLHEALHAKEFMLLHDKSNDLMTKILSVRFNYDKEKIDLILKMMGYDNNLIELYNRYLKNQEQRNYKNNYIKAPEERYADIYSFNILRNMFEPLKDGSSNIYNYLDGMLLSNILCGYEDNVFSSPTIEYLENNGNGYLLNKFDWYDIDKNICHDKVVNDLSFNDRLLNGLFLNKAEYNSLLNRKKISYSNIHR